VLSEFRPKSIGRYSRLYLLLLSEINLILGAVFFAYPSLVVSFWPWTIKELAVRFLGAIFLAITFGCWSSLRAKGWQRGKVLPLVGGVFFGITAIIMAAQGTGPLNLAWAAYFFLASLGLFAIIWHHGWYRRLQDNIETGPAGKISSLFFRIQTVVVGVFGTLMLFLPDIAQQQFWPWHVAVPTLQTFAALFLATCLATGWAVRQADKGRILALLPLDAVFPAMALIAVGIHWNVIAAESPGTLVTGVWVSLYSFVSVGSAYLYSALRKR
jgi:hypothetical protein